MLPITGYADRFSAPPGGRIAFKVSSTFEEDYAAEMIRIRHGDPNPAGPGLKYERVPSAIDGAHPSRFQPVHLGSHGVIEAGAALESRDCLTLEAVIWPTTPAKPAQAVLSWADPAAGSGFALTVGPGGAGLAVGAGPGRTVSATVGTRLRERVWYRIRARIDSAGRRIAVEQEPLDRPRFAADAGRAEAALPGPMQAAPDRPLLIAARQGRIVQDHYNGKIEAPRIAGARPEDVVAAWDFSDGIASMAIRDAGPHGLHGRLVNLPSRAVKGSRWDGAEMCWRHAPDHYAAIHFHDDDLYDCGWETDFTFEVPEGMASGVYGVRLRCQGAEDIIPFYVRPALNRPTAEVLFLASSFTYQIYGNHKRGNMEHAFRQRIRDWGAAPWTPEDHSDYAHSTYNFHSDGSGVGYSSRLRPLLNVRPNFLTFNDPRGSGLRHFPADTHILDWLTARGHAFDVATDEDLDDDGLDLLKPYKVVLTGSHPEYHTKGTLDALEAYTLGGGRLMYLGGNGFYWRIARHPDLPGVVEVRRAEGGIRAWAAEPGEYYHAFDGAYGGLWRRNDRPPQRLAGVGFSSQGMFEGSFYRRAAGADDPRAAWIMAGVDDEVIGGFGLSGGGAAGFELDRADRRLGTPADAIVLASSEAHSETFVVVPEDMLTHRNTWSGERPARLIRADMLYFETPAGGAVFSAGSITYCGSLSHNGYDNNVSRITDNVLRGFLGNRG